MTETEESLSTTRNPLVLQVPAFIAARTVINTVQRMVYPFLPVFARGLGVDIASLSYALSLRSATGLVGPFLAAIGDIRGRKTGLLVGMSLMTIGAAMVAIWPTYPVFVAMLILSITANFIFIPSVQAFIGDRVPYERRGFVIALTEFAWSLSFIIGVPVVGFLIARGGWMAPFPWLAGLGLLMMAVLWILIPNDRPKIGTVPSFWSNIGSILRHPPARAGILVAIGMSGANELVNLIFGVWLEDTFAVKIAALAVASAVIGISELCGEVLVTGLVDRLGKRRSASLGLVLNALAALALLLLGGNLTAAFIGLFLFYLTFEFTMVSSLPLMTEVMPAARATFMAAFIASTALGRSVGSLIAPGLYRAGQSMEQIPAIFFTVAAAAVLDLLALAALRRIHEGAAAQSPV